VIYAIPAVRWMAAILVEDDEQPAVVPETPRLAALVGAACAAFGVVATVVAGPLLYAANQAATALR
jgi:hypothetical protein